MVSGLGDGVRLITENGSLMPINVACPHVPESLKYISTKFPFNGKSMEAENLILRMWGSEEWCERDDDVTQS